MTGLLNDYEENFVKFNEDLTILKNCFFFRFTVKNLAYQSAKFRKMKKKNSGLQQSNCHHGHHCQSFIHKKKCYFII